MSVPDPSEGFSNGMATAALTVALAGLLLGVVPFIGILGIPLAVLAIPLALAGKRRSLTRHKAGYGRSIAALVIASLTLVAVVASTFLWRSGSDVQRSVESPVDLERK